MNHLGLFAKFWQSGTVKTRLAATIGNDKACNLYRTFVFHLLTRLENSADQRSLVFSPLSKQADFRASVPHSWALQAQHDGDLGNRMGGFFDNILHQKSDDPASPNPTLKRKNKALVIGADCPLVSPETIETAFKLLDEVPVVFGPSLDGGYYLLGMRENCPSIFSNISWSTEHVLQQSIANLSDAKVEYLLLDPMSDIDEIDELMNLQTDLKQRASSLDSLDLNLLEHIELATAEVEKSVPPRTTKAGKQ